MVGDCFIVMLVGFFFVDEVNLVVVVIVVEFGMNIIDCVLCVVIVDDLDVVDVVVLMKFGFFLLLMFCGEFLEWLFFNLELWDVDVVCLLCEVVVEKICMVIFI